MGYVKPGVEVQQKQVRNTPILNTPELDGCIVGNSYKWVDPTLETSIVSTLLTGRLDSTHTGTLVGGDAATFVLSGVNADYYDVSEGDDKELVIVDLLGISGDAIGSVKHLLYDADYSVNTATSGTLVTISGTATVTDSNYQVRVGYRALNSKTSEGVKTVVSINDVQDVLGETVSWNPLAYGAQIAMSNSGTELKVLKVDGIDTTDMTNAINNYLSLEEVYAIAPMSQTVTYADMTTHCNTASLPTEKKERIAFPNKVIAYGKDPKTMTSSDKATLAATLRDEASATQERRVFAVRPDVAYTLERRHISTISPNWIAKSFAASCPELSFSTNKLYAKFASDITINSVKYKTDTLIDETIWNTLMSSGWGGSSGMIVVKVPVPGYYYGAVAVGQVIGTPVSQPLTNVPGTGLSEVFGSSDLFSETLLNKIAEGGNWIYVQDSKTGPIYCRHQMSTDVTSIAKRELSITKALDFTAKFIRKGLKPYIGRYNITPAFLKLVDTVLNGIARYLVREGYIEDMKILSVKQDDINPDTIYVDIDIKVLYPVNYIKVSLQF